MKSWTIAALIASAGLIGLGVAMNNGTQSMIAVSTPLVVAGIAGAAVCVILWLARSIGLSKRSAKPGQDSARIQTLISELVECARQADARGVLTLSDRTLHDRNTLFAKGVEMLVSADNPAKIREALKAAAERDASDADARGKRLAMICRILPVASLTMALTTMVWILTVVGGVSELGPYAPLALLAAVYGAFTVAAVSIEIGDRINTQSAEKELTGSLVIETIVAIRSGESPDRVAGILRGMTPSQRADLATPQVRKAA